MSCFTLGFAVGLAAGLVGSTRLFRAWQVLRRVVELLVRPCFGSDLFVVGPV